MNKITQRDVFWETVYQHAVQDKNIIVIVADMGAPSLDIFKKNLPRQFINVGIAEQNAINIGAGLALEGMKVFIYAISPFITLRCFEQIRISSAIMKIPLTIVGVGAGFGYEDSGPTHHLIEDLACIRSIPNIRIDSITDNSMAEHFAQLSCRERVLTNYIRLERKICPIIYPNNYNFSKGLAVLKKSKKAYLITTGIMTHIALEIVKKNSAINKNLGIIDLYNFPINENNLIKEIKNIKKIITLEEHFLAGGLGSAVLEALNDQGLFIPVKRLGLSLDKGYCYAYGGRKEIYKYYNLNMKIIIEKIIRFISNL